MTQSGNSTREDIGEARLPSVLPADLEAALQSEEKLAVANEFFSSIDTDQVSVPSLSEMPEVEVYPPSAIPGSADEVEIVAELDTSLEDDLDDALNEVLGSDLQQALPQPTVTSEKAAKLKAAKLKAAKLKAAKLKAAKLKAAKLKARKAKAAKAIPVARRRRSRIEIKEREDEPFHWRELFTWKGIKRNSSFLVSLLLHMCVLLFLSLLVVRNGIGDSTLFLDVAEAPAAADEDMLADLAMDTVEFNDVEIEDSPLSELLEDALEKEEAEKDALEVEDLTQNDGPLGGRAPSARRSQGDGKSATFFGTKASGRRFVFVVDRSTSMEYGSGNFVSRELFNRYDVAKSELLNAIESLQPHQEFFVVMFAHNTVPMFGLKSVEENGKQEYEMISANTQNVARFQGWLEGVTMGPGTDPRLALEIAIEMQPDAIFMLSDGAFVSERNDDRPKTREIIQQYISAGLIVPINTTSLVVEQTIPTMKSIADRSGGSFKFTTIKDYIKQIANLRGPMRSRALEQLIASADDSWEARREVIVDRLLPMLTESSKTEQISAESLLHRATMGFFESYVDSVFEKGNKARQQWSDIVREIDGYYRTEQVTALGQGRELQQRILLSMLELKDDSYVALFDRLDMDRVSSLTMIEMVHGIDRGHLAFGTSPESVGWLRELVARLGGKKPKERSQLGKVEWGVEQAQAAIDRLFESRQKRAADLYRKYKNPDKTMNVRQRFAEALVKKYPETKEAGRVRLQLEVQRAGDVPDAEQRMTTFKEAIGQ